MAAKRTLLKVVDEIDPIRCASGRGVIREEVWQDAEGNIARYNLAFVNHFLTAEDNGRVLGYDNSHGYHHRHFKGSTEPFQFTTYEALIQIFLDEVGTLRKEKR